MKKNQMLLGWTRRRLIEYDLHPTATMHSTCMQWQDETKVLHRCCRYRCMVSKRFCRRWSIAVTFRMDWIRSISMKAAVNRQMQQLMVVCIFFNNYESDTVHVIHSTCLMMITSCQVFISTFYVPTGNNCLGSNDKAENWIPKTAQISTSKQP